MAQPDRDEREQRAARLADAVNSRGRSRQASPQRVHRIHAPGVDVAAVARRLVAWYQARLLRAQIVAQQPDLCLVQCRNGPWRQAVGMAFELTVELRRDGADLHLGIGWAQGGAGIPAYGFQLPGSLASAALQGMEQQLLSDQTLTYVRSLLWAQRVRGAWQSGVLWGPAPASRGRARPAREVEAVPTDVAHATGQPEGAADRGRQADDQGSLPPSPAAVRIDINAATVDQLMRLPGMDRPTAEKVITVREARGGLTGVQQIVDAAGLKPHMLVQLRPRLAVGERPRSGAAQAGTGRDVDRLAGPGRVIDV